MLRDILLNHAWGLFNHSELTLLEESLKSAAVGSLLRTRVGAAPGLADESQHRYSEEHLLARRAGDGKRDGYHPAWRI